MGEITKIAWCDATFNPWRGCQHAILPNGDEHPGCHECYAEAMSKRNPAVLGKWGHDGTRVRAKDSYWREPLKWNREAEREGVRRRVFCASLADVFEDWDGPIIDHKGCGLYRCSLGCGHVLDGARPTVQGAVGPYCSRCERHTFPLTMDDLRHDLFKLIDSTPNLDWLLLTKRPQNVFRMWPENVSAWETFRNAERLSSQEIEESSRKCAKLFRRNVWIGTSVSDQASADEFIPELLNCRDLVPVLFLSMEPLLGPIDISTGSYASNGRGLVWDAFGNVVHAPHCDYKAKGIEPQRINGVSWVIVGGESGPNARPCDVDWIRSIVRQCREANIACFVKQLGAKPYDSSILMKVDVTSGFPAVAHSGNVLDLRDKKGGDWNEWRDDAIRVREFPNVEART